MLLQNYDYLMAFSNMCQRSDGSGQNSPSGISLKRYDGITTDAYVSTSGLRLPMVSFRNDANQHTFNSSQYNNLIVGSDDTPVTYTDSKISPISTSSITPLTHTNSNVLDETTGEIVSTYRKTFNALADITIKEIGVMYGVPYNSSSANGFLVYREVLETPIEVPLGANVVITLTKRISTNPNQPADYVATANVE